MDERGLGKVYESFENQEFRPYKVSKAVEELFEANALQARVPNPYEQAEDVIDRIQEVLAQRIIIGSIHIRNQMYDLQHEILTFGPRMGHDDTIDALAYACKYSTMPTGVEGSKGAYRKRKPKPKSWIVA